MPLAVTGHTVGALNLYSPRQNAFAGPARPHAIAFGAQSAAALTVALRMAQHGEVHRQLTEAMSARSVVDQALGILMSQQRCTASTAFDLLRQVSQHRNRKLRDIAADLITNVTGQPPQPPVDFQTVDPRSAGA